MVREERFVTALYEKYQGRVALGVGYGQGLQEIFPFVFEDENGISIGIIALDSMLCEENVVHIFHIGSFVSKQGDGSRMMKELCRVADAHRVTLSLSPIFMSNGKEESMTQDKLLSWYGRFGFEGEGQLLRLPVR